MVKEGYSRSIGLKRGPLGQRVTLQMGETLVGTHKLVEAVEQPCSGLPAHTTEVCKVTRGDEWPASRDDRDSWGMCTTLARRKLS